METVELINEMIKPKRQYRKKIRENIPDFSVLKTSNNIKYFDKLETSYNYIFNTKIPSLNLIGNNDYIPIYFLLATRSFYRDFASYEQYSNLYKTDLYSKNLFNKTPNTIKKIISANSIYKKVFINKNPNYFKDLILNSIFDGLINDCILLQQLLYLGPIRSRAITDLKNIFWNENEFVKLTTRGTNFIASSYGIFQIIENRLVPHIICVVKKEDFIAQKLNIILDKGLDTSKLIFLVNKDFGNGDIHLKIEDIYKKEIEPTLLDTQALIIKAPESEIFDLLNKNNEYIIKFNNIMEKRKIKQDLINEFLKVK